MTIFGRASARALVAACLVLMSRAIAQAAGALAIGACGAYGFAFDFAGDPVARNAALRKCEGDCKVVAVLSRNCAAFAIDMRNACGFHGHAMAARLGLAQNQALRQCYQNGGKDCVLRAFVCDAKG
jgi:formate-dependent phosphoribosylglycinamide formyltransferase (GAR transformylase)